MKRNLFTYFLFFFFSLVYFQTIAQEVRVIDNKGTKQKVRNTRVYTNTKPLNDDAIIGDIYFDLYPNPTIIQVWNGTAWLNLNDNSTHTGTTGSVFFAGSSGIPTEDPHLFWSNTTTNPKLFIGNRPTNFLTGAAKLNIYGATRTQGVTNSNGTVGTPSYRFTGDADTGIFRGPSANNMGFVTGGLEAFRVDENQNIGMGTLSPTQKLDVVGKVRIRNVEDLTSTGLSVGDKIVIIDANGVVKKITGSFHTIGDIKHGVQSGDHNGWYLLDGRALSSLPASARVAALSLSLPNLATNLPDATDKVLKHSSGGQAILSTGGFSNVTLSSNNIPTLTGKAESTGSEHQHNVPFKYYNFFDNSGGGGLNGIGSRSSGIDFQITNNDGSHEHNVTVNSGSSNDSFEIYQPYLVVNTFIYLGL